MKINTYFIVAKMRRKDWEFHITPSLFIGRYRDGFSIVITWFIFEFNIDVYTNESGKN